MNYISFSSLDAHKLSVEGIFSLTRTTIETAKPVIQELGPVAGAAFTHMEQLQSELGATMNKSQKSAFTLQIKTLDESRDSDIREIFRVTKTYLGSSDAEKKSAASTLQLFLSPYKGVAKLPINFETGTLAGLIDKYKTNQGLLSAAKLLGVDGLFTSMEAKNTELDLIYQSRNTEYSVNEGAASDVKPAMVIAYMQFCTAIEQANAYTPNETISALFNKMDELRKKYHALEGKKDVPEDTAASN